MVSGAVRAADMSVAAIGAVDYTKALDGLSLKQAQLMLTTQGIVGEEQKDLLVKQGLIATSDRMSASLVAEALANNGLNKEKQEALLIESGLMNAKTKELITENAVTESKLRAILAENGIKGAKADTLIASILQTGQNTKEAVSWKVLASSIKETTIALLTNPITWVVGAIASIGLLVKGYDALIGRQEKLARTKIEGLTEDISEFDTEINSLEELQNKLESAKGNKAELAKIQAELNDVIGHTPGLLNGESKAWDAANVKIQANIDLLKQQRKEAQRSKVNASKELFDNNTYEVDWGFDITGDKMRYAMAIYQEYVNAYKEMDEESIKWAKILYGDFENAEDYAFKRLQHEGIQIGDGVTYNVNLNQSDWENYWREQVDVAYDVFEDTIDTYDGVGGQSFLKNLISNMVMSGSDLSQISNAITHVIENEDIQNVINDYWESLVDPNIDSEKALSKVKSIFDGIVAQFPELASFFDNFYNQITTAGSNAAKSAETNVHKITVPSLEELNKQLDTIQSAYKSVQSAIEEYNTQGYISVDTFQSLMDIAPEHLQYLMDEEGNLRLGTEAMNEYTSALIDNMAMKQIQNLIDYVGGLSAEERQLYLTGQAAKEASVGLMDFAAGQLATLAASGKLTDGELQQVTNMVENIIGLANSAKLDLFSGLGGGSGASDDFKDAVEKNLAFYKAELDAGIIDFKTYLDKSNALLDDYYNKSKLSAVDYWEFKKQILENELEGQNKAIQAVTDAIDDRIDGIKAEQDAIQKKIDLLNDEAEANKLGYDIEKARYDLARLQTQKTKKLYLEGSGYTYKADEGAIREKQNELADLERDQIIAGLEKEKDALNDFIAELEKYRDAWAEIPNLKEQAENELYAVSILGATWEQDILNNRTDALDSFKNNYLNIQKAIADGAWHYANETNKAQASIGSGETNGGASAFVDDVELDVPKTKYKTGGGVKRTQMYYGSGTRNAKKGLNFVGEAGKPETFIDNDGNAAIITKPTLVPMEGGETVLNGKETEDYFDLSNYVPIETFTFNGIDGKPFEISADDLHAKFHALGSNYGMNYPNIQMPKFDIPMVNNNQNITTTIGDIHLHEVQNIRDFASDLDKHLPNIVVQYNGRH